MAGEGKGGMKPTKGDGGDHRTWSWCAWWQRPRDSKSGDQRGRVLLSQPPFFPGRNGADDKNLHQPAAGAHWEVEDLAGELDEVPSGGCGEARASGPGKILEGCQGPGCLQRADETVMAVAIILILIIMHAKLGRGGPDSPRRSEEKELIGGPRRCVPCTVQGAG